MKSAGPEKRGGERGRTSALNWINLFAAAAVVTAGLLMPRWFGLKTASWDQRLGILLIIYISGFLIHEFAHWLDVAFRIGLRQALSRKHWPQLIPSQFTKIKTRSKTSPFAIKIRKILERAGFLGRGVLRLKNSSFLGIKKAFRFLFFQGITVPHSRGWPGVAASVGMISALDGCFVFCLPEWAAYWNAAAAMNIIFALSLSDWIVPVLERILKFVARRTQKVQGRIILYPASPRFLWEIIQRRV